MRSETRLPPVHMARPLIGQAEKRAVLGVLESGQLAQGEVVARFEAAFAAEVGVKHCVATSSGTTALHLALLALGLGPGDEVITSPFSFIASANAALFCGARPVFADIDPATFNLDPAAVEPAITPRTKAIVPVHLFGQPADMDALTALAERYGLRLVEDACQAHGAAWRGRAAGAFGIGCFSFYPTKNLTTAEGGAVTTDDDDVADRVRVLRNHGMRQRYHHEVLGYNFRLTDLQAAVGLAQLPHLRNWNAARRANAAHYDAELRGVVTPAVRPEAEHVYHQYTLRVRDRDRAASRLAEQGIGTGVYYPIPIHRQRFYVEAGLTGSFPEAERAAEEVLSIPVRPDLTGEERDRVVAAVNAL
ncbi:MAG TPA: DegT/DnrJ/EryC1/StrS family aminotransferase [Chloroflexota bacterium]|nr:DegT/DnrJ/EryC1/StrS family aminotransferase [Chloroflexota bacterium]